eukprot:COSAG01_NODE_212_length_21797_cov_14.197806_4_plen_51_part_00
MCSSVVFVANSTALQLMMRMAQVGMESNFSILHSLPELAHSAHTSTPPHR